MIPQTTARPQASAVFLPHCREVATGTQYAGLAEKCAFALAHGAVTRVRLTRPIKGERFACRIVWHLAAKTGQTWIAAEYRSLTIKGHVRRLLIAPDGQSWTLLQETGKATSQPDKYNAHLFAALEDY